MYTAPASTTPSTSAYGAPIARSLIASLLKSARNDPPPEIRHCPVPSSGPSTPHMSRSPTCGPESLPESMLSSSSPPESPHATTISTSHPILRITGHHISKLREVAGHLLE